MLKISREVHNTFHDLFTDAEFDVRDVQVRIAVYGNQCEGISFSIDVEPAFRGESDIYIGCVEGGTLVVTDVFSYAYLHDADLKYDPLDDVFVVAFPVGVIGCACPSSQVDSTLTK